MCTVHIRLCSPSSSQILTVTRFGQTPRTPSTANPCRVQIKNSHGSTISSLMIDNTTLLLELDLRVPTSVNNSMVPLMTSKSLPGKAANNKVKCGRFIMACVSA